MSETKELLYTEEEAVEAFNSSISGQHGCTTKYTAGSKEAFVMWLRAIKEHKLKNNNYDRRIN